MKKTISIILVLALGLTAKVANADFTFGEPTNLGPTVNSSSHEQNASISADGLSLFFISKRTGGVGGTEIWVTTRETTDDPWGTPVNLGPAINSPVGDGGVSISYDGLSLYFSSTRSSGYGSGDLWVTMRDTIHNEWDTPLNLGSIVNSSADESYPSISADGLAIYFTSNRGGGNGRYDIWVTTRETIHDPWGTPVNLGPTVNSSAYEVDPGISADGRTLLFASDRSGGYGSDDIWMTRRATTGDPWGEPVNLGPIINSSGWEDYPNVSSDGSTLFFVPSLSDRWNGGDIWQVPIIPIVDFNGDGIVDSADLDIMVDRWHTDEPLCDIGPTPLGDGIVDAQDMLVLTEYLTEEKVDVEADIAAIEGVLIQYCVAMETGDLELWLSLHADEIVKMAPDAPATFGQEELRASSKPLFDNFTIEMVYNCEEIQVDGDLGFARGAFTSTMTPKAGGEPLYIDAKTLGIYKRQADGSWKLARNCYNSNVPPGP